MTTIVHKHTPSYYPNALAFRRSQFIVAMSFESTGKFGFRLELPTKS